jgi:hypothetical protein
MYLEVRAGVCGPSQSPPTECSDTASGTSARSGPQHGGITQETNHTAVSTPSSRGRTGVVCRYGC